MSTLRKDFDTKENLIMLHTKSEKALYHSKLADQDVHAVSASSEYAAKLMITDKNYELGLKVFNKVIPLQDTDPKSPYFGVFPWYAEEPVAEMNPPDFNMADFNAKAMILAIKKEGHAIDDETMGKLKQAISNACECIIRRNEGVQYTNIAIMDALVTVSGGELLGNERFMSYGRNKLRRFLDFTRGHHSVTEYNSPCYTIVMVNDIGTILEIVEDEETKKLANEANDIAWEMLASHFDYSNLQLTGPQVRAYYDYVDVNFIKTLGKACGIDFTKHEKFYTYFSKEDAERILEDDCSYPKCPEKYIPYFNGEKRVKSLQRMVMDGYNYPWFEFVQVATNYKTGTFSIGTMNRSEMWNQRRPFLAYIKGADKDCCFRVKCYHDGFDYSSGALHTIQDKGRALGNLSFSNDRGDTHVGLDLIKNATISAEDLRLSFEFECGENEISYKKTEHGIELDINGTKVKINTYLKLFGDKEPEEEVRYKDNRLSYSIVFYHGDRKDICFDKLDAAIVGFTVEMGSFDDNAKVEYKENDGMIETKWTLSDCTLELATIKKPSPFRDNLYFDRQLIDGIDIMKKTFNEI